MSESVEGGCLMDMNKGFKIVVQLFKLFTDKKYQKYSKEWRQSLSDDELKTGREKVRKYWCHEEKTLSEAIRAENLLMQFDKEMSNRDSDGNTEHGFPRHTEHGWYLSGDD